MATGSKTRVRHTIKRVRRAWAEMDYAQRRLFEIRTGLEVTEPPERRRPATTAEELEALYALDQPRRRA